MITLVFSRNFEATCNEIYEITAKIRQKFPPPPPPQKKKERQNHMDNNIQYKKLITWEKHHHWSRFILISFPNSFSHNSCKHQGITISRNIYKLNTVIEKTYCSRCTSLVDMFVCIFSTIKKDISDVELGERATQILPHTLTQAPCARGGGGGGDCAGCNRIIKK